MKVMSRFILFAVIASVCFSLNTGYGEIRKGRLKISVINIANNDGTVNLALYNSQSDYASKDGKPYLREKVSILNKKAEIEFSDVPFGEYGIKVYHDENSNGVMDKNFMGIPKEDYAFSNNAAGTLGAPPYNKVKFSFHKSDMTLEIKMTSVE
jgi:uncharacterized protein (DUF2141 family)